MAENAKRIIDGLNDAARMAACEHRSVLPFHRVLGQTRWHCTDCGGEFSFHPKRGALPAQHQGGGRG